ncbi:MAG: hypothetical protein KDC12_12240 [Flavobacteriales bacterium]|nr:hypothetical protein [Flavobacteriales bacterium]
MHTSTMDAQMGAGALCMERYYNFIPTQADHRSGDHVRLDLDCELDNKLDEVSGVAQLSPQELVVLNDGGNDPEVYVLDRTTCEITKTLKIKGKENHDWEDLALSPDQVFVGDFGNNTNGKRKNLRVLVFPRSALSKEHDNDTKVEEIEFYYPEQDLEKESGKALSTEWDCEAMIWLNGELHLFTKDWKTKRCKHYMLPDKPGSYAATFVEEFDTKGLVTAADLTPDGRLMLLGYTQLGRVFMWEFWNSPNGFFNGKSRRHELGNVMMVGQAESLVMLDDNNGLILTELWERRRTRIPPRMYSFEMN